MESSIVRSFFLFNCLTRLYGNVQSENYGGVALVKVVPQTYNDVTTAESNKMNGMWIPILSEVKVPSNYDRLTEKFRENALCFRCPDYEERRPQLSTNLARSSVGGVNAPKNVSSDHVFETHNERTLIILTDDHYVIDVDPRCDVAWESKKSIYRGIFCTAAINETIDNFDVSNEDKKNTITKFRGTSILIRRTNTSGNAEVQFDVDESTIEVRINIEGYIVKAIVEIPFVDETGTETGQSISLTRKEGRKGMKIVALNAPPGGWRLKLVGKEASKYSLLVESRGIRKEKKQEETRNPVNVDEEIRHNRDEGDSHATLRKRSSPSDEKKGEGTDETTGDVEIRGRILFGNAPQSTDANMSRIVNNNAGNKELLDVEEFAKISEDETIGKSRIVVELNPNSNLLVKPATIHRIIFDVTNNYFQAIRCEFKIRSLPLRVLNVQPVYTWIFAGRTINVFVDVEVPRGTSPDVIDTLTLYVQGTEITEKSVYLYVQSSLSKNSDTTKPSIEYSFNDNCSGKTGKDRCTKSRWSVDIRIQDSDSGLKRVTSSPNEIYPRSEFTSGTRSPVSFYYSATCCSTTAKITATDLLNNENTLTVDVSAAWDNLAQGEIAAIVLGALLILLLIILIIVLIAYCVRRRKSHDLPYSQRYASRPAARADRTSF